MPRPPISATPAVDWPGCAARLAEKIPPARLHPRVIQWLETRAGAREPRAVAVSGGADSVALLLLLWAHFPKARKQLVVFHYDHAARADSASDAAFVRALAKSLRVACALGRRDAGANAAAHLSEDALREARRQFFREQLDARKGRILFLGHQRDDIVETLLMRISRGSGAGGLCAPRPVRIFADEIVALRPLLDLDREEIRAALRESGAVWREDPTNDADTYLRSRLRRHVIPAWRAAVGARDLAAGAARSRALLEDDDEALETIANVIAGMGAAGAPLPLTPLAGQSRALWRRALRRWLEAQSLGRVLSAAAFDNLHGALILGEGGRWSAGHGCWLEVREGALFASREDVKQHGLAQWPARPLRPGQPVLLPGGGSVVATLVDNPSRLIAALKEDTAEGWRHACLALTAEPAEIEWTLRPWRAGDRYRPLGAPGSRKVQDQFTDKKVPAVERRRRPVVCGTDGKPVWAPGLAPAESHRVQPETRRALWLTYYPSGDRM